MPGTYFEHEPKWYSENTSSIRFKPARHYGTIEVKERERVPDMSKLNKKNITHQLGCVQGYHDDLSDAIACGDEEEQEEALGCLLDAIEGVVWEYSRIGKLSAEHEKLLRNLGRYGEG